MIRKFFSFSNEKIKVSSANCIWLIHTLFLPISKPCTMFKDLALKISLPQSRRKAIETMGLPVDAF